MMMSSERAVSQRRRAQGGGDFESGEGDRLVVEEAEACRSGRRPRGIRRRQEERGCCSWWRRCAKRILVVGVLVLIFILCALHFGVVVMDPKPKRWWWPWRWSSKMSRAFAVARGREDGRDAWRRQEEQRVGVLESALKNVTARLGRAETQTSSAVASLARVEDELSKLKTEAYSNAPDLELRDEMRSQFAALEAENAVRDAEFAAATRDLDVRVNATDARERRDHLSEQAALVAQEEAQRAYADTKSYAVESRVDAKLVDVYATLGDYKETTKVRFDSERDLIYHWIAGTFALLCFLVSLSGVYAHTRALAVPDVQRKILALLWMPPIYSWCCWLSLLYPSSSAGLGMVRDGYEAYTIWVFVSFLISILGDDNTKRTLLDAAAAAAAAASASASSSSSSRENEPPEGGGGVRPPRRESQSRGDEGESSSYSRVVAKLEADGNEHRPRAFCPPFGQASARSFLKQCMIATLQFVVVKPLCSVVDYVLVAAAAQRAYEEAPNADIQKIRACVFIFNNLSVTVAFSGLLKVYHAVAHHLHKHNPWPKFCSVKGIVFITFWQGTVIWVMTHYSGSFANKDVADAVQNFLICVEMFIASVVHSYTFAADEWQPNYHPPNLQISDNLAVGDFLKDLRYVFKSSSNPNESDPLIPVFRAEMVQEKKRLDLEDDYEPPAPAPAPAPARGGACRSDEDEKQLEDDDLSYESKDDVCESKDDSRDEAVVLREAARCPAPAVFSDDEEEDDDETEDEGEQVRRSTTPNFLDGGAAKVCSPDLPVAPRIPDTLPISESRSSKILSDLRIGDRQQSMSPVDDQSTSSATERASGATALAVSPTTTPSEKKGGPPEGIATTTWTNPDDLPARFHNNSSSTHPASLCSALHDGALCTSNSRPPPPHHVLCDKLHSLPLFEADGRILSNVLDCRSMIYTCVKADV